MSIPQRYKKTDLGVIPEDWEVKVLGDLGSFSKGKGISKNDIVDFGIPCIRYAEIYTKYDYVIKEFQSFINEESANNSKKLKQFDILFAGSGETVEDIGKSVAFLHNIEAYVGGDTVIFSPKEKTLDSLFMSYQLNNNETRKQLRKIAQGNSVVHIYSKSLAGVKVNFPPLEEQKKIAEILSTVDEKIAFVDKSIEETQTLKKGLMQKLLTEGIGHTEFKESELGRIPVEWEVVQLDKLGDFSKGKGIPKSEVTEKGYPCIRYAEIYTQYNIVIHKFKSFINDKSAKLSHKLKQNDILFAGSGETIEDIGKSVTFLENFEAYVGGDTIVFSPKDKLLDSLFMSYQLNSHDSRKQLRKLGQGNSVVHIYSKELKTLNVKLPSLEEQKQIAEILSTTDEKLENLKAKKEAFEELKKGLMQKLLTGEIRV